MREEPFQAGTHIRKLRRSQGRTQQDIADACGFTKSLLSKIETGKVIPPVATLVKIANALGTKVSALVEEGENAGAVFTAREAVERNIVQTEQGYAIFPFATEHKEKKMQPFLFVVKRGEVKEHALSHDGEEFIYVLAGEIQFQVGAVTYTLRTGDSLYFDSFEAHQVIPVSEEAKYIDVFI